MPSRPVKVFQKPQTGSGGSLASLLVGQGSARAVALVGVAFFLKDGKMDYASATAVCTGAVTGFTNAGIEITGSTAGCSRSRTVFERAVIALTGQTSITLYGNATYMMEGGGADIVQYSGTDIIQGNTAYIMKRGTTFFEGTATFALAGPAWWFAMPRGLSRGGRRDARAPRRGARDLQLLRDLRPRGARGAHLLRPRDGRGGQDARATEPPAGCPGARRLHDGAARGRFVGVCQKRRGLVFRAFFGDCRASDRRGRALAPCLARRAILVALLFVLAVTIIGGRVRVVVIAGLGLGLLDLLSFGFKDAQTAFDSTPENVPMEGVEGLAQFANAVVFLVRQVNCGSAHVIAPDRRVHWRGMYLEVVT